MMNPNVYTQPTKEPMTQDHHDLWWLYMSEYRLKPKQSGYNTYCRYLIASWSYFRVSDLYDCL